MLECTREGGRKEGRKEEAGGVLVVGCRRIARFNAGKAPEDMLRSKRRRNGDSPCWKIPKARRSASTLEGPNDFLKAPGEDCDLPTDVRYSKDGWTSTSSLLEGAARLLASSSSGHFFYYPYPGTWANLRTFSPHYDALYSFQNEEHIFFICNLGWKPTWVLDLGRWLVHRPSKSLSEASRDLSRVLSP
jgi:hypothetical protein